MKTNLIVLFLFFISLNCHAQFWGSNQDAYNAGKQAMESEIDYIEGQTALIEGNYNTAYERFSHAIKLNNAKGCEGLGVMYELGIGVTRDVDQAGIYYKVGAQNGNYACQLAIQRINSNGYLPASYKNTFLSNLRKQREQSTMIFNNGGGYVGGGYTNGASQSSSSSGKAQCPNCHGSGYCTYCNGRGETKIETYNSTTWKKCIICNGYKTCRSCAGKGFIRY